MTRTPRSKDPLDLEILILDAAIEVVARTIISLVLRRLAHLGLLGWRSLCIVFVNVFGVGSSLLSLRGRASLRSGLAIWGRPAVLLVESAVLNTNLVGTLLDCAGGCTF
jgi:hypothetical protein